MVRVKQSRLTGAMAIAGVALLAACEGRMPTEESSLTFHRPAADVIPTTPTVQPQHFKVCKVGTDANFTFSVNGGADTPFSLKDGECVSVHQFAGFPQHQVSVTELAQDGVQLDSIILTRFLGGGPIQVTTTKLTGTNTASGQIEFEEGWVATFYNSPEEPPPGGGTEGCTPGYWKNHLKRWPVSTNLSFNATFGVNIFEPDFTLLQAVKQGGGHEKRLGRHAVAAYLNSLVGIDYKYTTAEVIALVQAGNADALEKANERGCPLN